MRGNDTTSALLISDLLAKKVKRHDADRYIFFNNSIRFYKGEELKAITTVADFVDELSRGDEDN